MRFKCSGETHRPTVDVGIVIDKYGPVGCSNRLSAECHDPLDHEADIRLFEYDDFSTARRPVSPPGKQIVAGGQGWCHGGMGHFEPLDHVLTVVRERCSLG